ncbi:hypothetical protein [Bacillus halotolerans]|uniref:hypothetical protein n=1 Tax=Bacillus halotolerans TaxID=260554 RepID=UPI004049234B
MRSEKSAGKQMINKKYCLSNRKSDFMSSIVLKKQSSILFVDPKGEMHQNFNRFKELKNGGENYMIPFKVLLTKDLYDRMKLILKDVIESKLLKDPDRRVFPGHNSTNKIAL